MEHESNETTFKHQAVEAAAGCFAPVRETCRDSCQNPELTSHWPELSPHADKGGWDGNGQLSSDLLYIRRHWHAYLHLLIVDISHLAKFGMKSSLIYFKGAQPTRPSPAHVIRPSPTAAEKGRAGCLWAGLSLPWPSVSRALCVQVR